MNSYITIKKKGKSFVKDSNSKFYGFAFQVNDQEEVSVAVEEVKTQHPGASHYCYAFILGHDGNEQRANDDGEPGNSAGQPILRQILSLEVVNVLVVVVRFYGGRKLGIPGLIHAYGESARLALEDAETTVIEVSFKLIIRDILKNDYLIYSFVKRYDGMLVEPANSPGGDFVLSFPIRKKDELVEALKELPNFDWREQD